MRQANAAGVSFRLIKIEPEIRALLKLLAVTGKDPDAQFRTLQISEDTDSAAGLVLKRADDAVFLADFLMTAVAHVQAEYIRTGHV